MVDHDHEESEEEDAVPRAYPNLDENADGKALFDGDQEIKEEDKPDICKHE